MINKNTQFSMDSDGSIFFARELEKIMEQSFDVLQQPLSSKRLIQSRNDNAKPWHKKLTYRVFENTGEAKVIADNATDYPIVNVRGTEVTHDIVTLGDVVRYSIFEIEAARAENKDLDGTLIKNALMEHERAMNRICFYGAPEYGIHGWLTNPKITNVATSTSGVAWNGGATADQMVNDVNEAIISVRATTNTVHEPNTVVLDVERYGIAQTTRLQDQVTTVLEQLKNTNPGVRFTYAHELAGAFNGQNGMIVYNDNKETIWQEVPQLFKAEPSQAKGAHVEVYIHSRYGGVVIAYPSSLAIRTGI